jgi:hypothetical protein
MPMYVFSCVCVCVCECRQCTNKKKRTSTKKTAHTCSFKRYTSMRHKLQRLHVGIIAKRMLFFKHCIFDCANLMRGVYVCEEEKNTSNFPSHHRTKIVHIIAAAEHHLLRMSSADTGRQHVVALCMMILAEHSYTQKGQRNLRVAPGAFISLNASSCPVTEDGTLSISSHIPAPTALLVHAVRLLLSTMLPLPVWC